MNPVDVPGDGGSVWGQPLDCSLPAPVPARYRLVPDGERRWRGIGAIHLWLLGFNARQAWVSALADDPVTVGHLRDEVAQDMLSGRTAMQPVSSPWR